MLESQYMHNGRYKDALDAALVTKRAEVVASVVEELAARAGLNAALGTRNAAGVAAILEHVRRHICDPRHARQLTAIAHRMMDAYAVKACPCQRVCTYRAQQPSYSRAVGLLSW